MKARSQKPEARKNSGKKTVYRKDDTKSTPGATSTEDQNVKIRTIKGSETLGYKGEAHGEHSGQNSPRPVDDLDGDLADNSTKKR